MIENPILIHARQLKGAAFGDKWLEKRGAALDEAICRHQSVNIRQVSQNWVEQMGVSRFLDNEQVSMGELTRSVASHCQQQVKG